MASLGVFHSSPTPPSVKGMMNWQVVSLSPVLQGARFHQEVYTRDIMEQYEDLCMRLRWDCQELSTKLEEGGKELDR